jgi:hypothetical protein
LKLFDSILYRFLWTQFQIFDVLLDDAVEGLLCYDANHIPYFSMLISKSVVRILNFVSDKISKKFTAALSLFEIRETSQVWALAAGCSIGLGVAKINNFCAFQRNNGAILNFYFVPYSRTSGWVPA